MNSSYLNNITIRPASGQTVVDPFLNDISTTTLNSNYIPIKKISTDAPLNEHIRISNYADYLPAEITIYHDTDKYGTFSVLFPSSFSESISATYVKESPVGSAYPIVAFSSTGNSTIPLTFDVLAEYLPSGISSLRQYVEGLKQMVRPKYSGDIVKSPWVLVKFADVSFEGVCDSLGIDYHNVYGNKSFIKATVTCQFTVTRYTM